MQGAGALRCTASPRPVAAGAGGRTAVIGWNYWMYCLQLPSMEGYGRYGLMYWTCTIGSGRIAAPVVLAVIGLAMQRVHAMYRLHTRGYTSTAVHKYMHVMAMVRHRESTLSTAYRTCTPQSQSTAYTLGSGSNHESARDLCSWYDRPTHQVWYQLHDEYTRSCTSHTA